jgi:uncharacterized protein (AIM24 family)
MNTNISVIDQIGDDQSSAEVHEWQTLKGSDDFQSAQTLYFAHQVGMRLKQVVLKINKNGVIIEPGALHFMHGNLTSEVKSGGIGGLVKKMATSALTAETVFRPRYFGTGEIYLEPSFGHYLLVQIDAETIVDKGMFYASQDTVEVSAAIQKHISAGIAGGEGWFQTKLTGRGWCVLASPVPANEIIKITLNNEKLSVDGNFALARKGNIDFKVEKSNKSILGTIRSGEGFLQTFTGTGEVWIAPTQSIYDRLSVNTLGMMANPSQRSSNTKT